MKGYDKEQTNDLLEQVIAAEKSGKSLSAVFAEFAAKTGRAKGSVRNYYYRLVKEAQTEGKLKEDFPKLNGISVSRNVNFTDDETEMLLGAVSDGLKRGESVRKTIYDLSGGDVRLALRYQNKYRNIKNRDKSVVNDKSAQYRQLSEKINGLIERIGADLRKENAILKERINALTAENKRLKREKAQSILSDFFVTETIENKIKNGK